LELAAAQGAAALINRGPETIGKSWIAPNLPGGQCERVWIRGAPRQFVTVRIPSAHINRMSAMEFHIGRRICKLSSMLPKRQLDTPSALFHFVKFSGADPVDAPPVSTPERVEKDAADVEKAGRLRRS